MLHPRYHKHLPGQPGTYMAASQGSAAGSPEGARAVLALLATERVADWIRARLGMG